MPHPHVRLDAAVLQGSPYVVGSRVPVRRLWTFYRSGVPLDALLRRFPQLTPGKVLDALAFAWDNAEVIEADIARERSLMALPAGRSTAAPARQLELPFD